MNDAAVKEYRDMLADIAVSVGALREARQRFGRGHCSQAHGEI